MMLTHPDDAPSAELCKDVRQKVRALMFNFKLESGKYISSKVDEYALKHDSRTWIIIF